LTATSKRRTNVAFFEVVGWLLGAAYPSRRQRRPSRMIHPGWAAQCLDEAHDFYRRGMVYEALDYVERYWAARRHQPEPWSGADSQADTLENAVYRRTANSRGDTDY